MTICVWHITDPKGCKESKKRDIRIERIESSRAQDYREIASELEKRLEGEVRFDRYSRLLYSTDASMYEIEPIGVVLPRHKRDVQSVQDSDLIGVRSVA